MRCHLSLPGTYFITHSMRSSGPSQYFTVMALEDNTEVRIVTPLEESFGLGSAVQLGPASTGERRFVLNRGESFKVWVSYFGYV